MVLPQEVINAINNGQVEVVKEWLDAAAPDAANDVDASGHGILYWCCLTDTGLGRTIDPARCEIARYAISRGCDVNRRDGITRSTPLHLAMAPSYLGSACNMISILIDAGADVNARTATSDCTPIAWAICALYQRLEPENSHRRYCRDVDFADPLIWLLRAGASINAVTRSLGWPQVYLSAEEYMLHREKPVRFYEGIEPFLDNEHWAGCKQLLADVREAGSWRKYVIVPMKEVLRLRSLVARGRARARLRTRSRTPRPLAWIMSPDVPKEIVGRVLEYWNPRR